MGWTEPKTDWSASDRFNAADYNRIIGNLNYLKETADKVYLGVKAVSLGEEKTYLSMIYAREFNAIENALENINVGTYGLNIGKKPVFAANKPTPMCSEYNRIEQSCLLLYNTLAAQINALPVLSFTLGGQKGIRV